MKTASAKAKGRKLQQWVRDLLLSLNPDLGLDDVRSTSMGAGGEDVLLSPLARRTYPVSIECKSKAKFVGYSIMEQARSNCPKGLEPVAVVKADRQKPLVMVDAEHYFELLAYTRHLEEKI